MAKRLYDVLKGCKKEEEVKASFCSFFKMKLDALKGIDHYRPTVFFEFKYDRNFRNISNIAHVIAQTMYYARLLKFNLTKYPLPPYICVVDKNEAFFIETRAYSKFYSSQSGKYDWDRAASTPCPVLVADIAAFPEIRKVYVYDLTNAAEEDQFVAKCREYLTAQMTFDAFFDKKSITEDNFLDVFEYWDSLFGDYVRNGRKSSEYFLADIEKGKSIERENGEVLFDVGENTLIRHGAKGNFPVGFLVWNLAKRKHLKEQSIQLDVFNADVEKIGTKMLPSVERTAMLNKWCPRPKWDGRSVMPMFSSAFKQQTENKDQRDHIAAGFLFSVVSKGDDFQNQNGVCILSSPYANAGAFSVTPENFERAVVLHAVKKVQKATWTNDRDAFYAPAQELPDEFVTDCAVWSAFALSNYAVALKDVPYKGSVYQIRNNLYPFRLDEVKGWPCGNSGIQTQMLAANEDRFFANWLKGRQLSPEAQAVLSAAKSLYRTFYAEIVNANWMACRIETWDVGYYQVSRALGDAGLATEEFAALSAAQNALREKLLPKVYEYGFLNPDVEYFQ